jgi:hypothetical protein
VARNVFALALLTALALSGCSKLDKLPLDKVTSLVDKVPSLVDKVPFLGNKKAKAEATMAAQRARADSLRKARRIADSIAVVRHAACVDSVRAELSKPVAKKGKRQKRGSIPSPTLIATQAQTACEQAVEQTKIAAKAAEPGESARMPAPAAKDTAARGATKDRAARGVARDTAARVPAKDTATRAMAKDTDARTASTLQQATEQSAWADSLRMAKETEMSRETFAYSGGTRDPFASLLNLAKSGPEVADLQLVGIYRNMRLPSGSIAVFREREGGKRHRLRAGDQLGRSRLVQIRERDVVFMIEDFGFERQETLSLRKQEDVTP